MTMLADDADVVIGVDTHCSKTMPVGELTAGAVWVSRLFDLRRSAYGHPSQRCSGQRRHRLGGPCTQDPTAEFGPTQGPGDLGEEVLGHQPVGARREHRLKPAAGGCVEQEIDARRRVQDEVGHPASSRASAMSSAPVTSSSTGSASRRSECSHSSASPWTSSVVRDGNDCGIEFEVDDRTRHGFMVSGRCDTIPAPMPAG